MKHLSGRMPRVALVLAVAVAPALFPTTTSAQRQTDRAKRVNAKRLKNYQSQHQQLKQKFARELKKIAEYCDEKKLRDTASKLRQVADAVVRPQKRIVLTTLRKAVRTEIRRDLPQEQRQWQLMLRKASTNLANGLYKLSREAIKAGPSYAYALVRETVRYNSDHVAARRMLGYVRNGDAWITPFEKKQAKKRKVWHDQFGWLPKDHVKRYMAGQRFSNGRWIRKERADEEHRNFRRPWRIQTEHYLVRTNHSLEEGVRVARTLEEYHHYFFQIYAGFFNSPRQIRQLFVGGIAAKNVRATLYKVDYFRTKAEYVNRLKGEFSNKIAMTTAMYHPQKRVCFFYHDAKVDNTPTLYHEATHQIFYESLPKRRPPRMIAEQSHFWIVEGIACYMESFQSETLRDEKRRDPKKQVTMGNPFLDRFQAAKDQERKGFYIRLEKFASRGRLGFQAPANISERYSQSAGLAKFFMEYDDGKYRDALIKHLSQLYKPKSGNFIESLDELTGVSYDELDRQYRAFIKALPDPRLQRRGGGRR